MACVFFDLFEFVQFGDVCYAGQAHVDEAEQLQVRKLFCDSFDFAVVRATVVQNELLDLRGGRVRPMWVSRRQAGFEMINLYF